MTCDSHCGGYDAPNLDFVANTMGGSYDITPRSYETMGGGTSPVESHAPTNVSNYVSSGPSNYIR